MKVLLIPDRPNWAFDFLARGLIKYNQDSSVDYSIRYVVDGTPMNWREWDAIMVYWVMEKLVGVNERVIRGCFSARWVAGEYTRDSAAAMLNGSRVAVFGNHFIRDDLLSRLKVPSFILEDSVDSEVFFPLAGQKRNQFTVLFAGNRTSLIKRYSAIKQACQEAGVQLRTVCDLSHEEMNLEYNKADVLVNYSIQEGGPTTMVEASMCGTPTVILHGVGLSDQIPCFEVSSFADLVQTLIRLKSSRDECREMGKRAQGVAIRSFTFDCYAKSFSRMLRSSFS